MKTLSVGAFVSSLLLVAISASAQSPSASTSWQVSDKGPHYRIWERTEYEIAPDGRQVPRVHRYTELATGLNFRNPTTGEWEESKEEIQLLPNGAGAFAGKGQHKAIFPANILDGKIELSTPEGQWLRSQVVGLAYYDSSSGKSVLITELKSSVGEIHSPNVVLYQDAFTDLKADVRYTYTRSGFEQDIVLREQPPGPAEYGLNPETTKIEVLTEFFNPPQPAVQSLNLKTLEGLTLPDQTLQFGTMSIGRGKAFSQDNPDKDVPVAKQWLKLDGRNFLSEEVSMPDLAEQLKSLPAAQGASLKSKTSKLRRTASTKRDLPIRKLAKAEKSQMKLAQAQMPLTGIVLDYNTLNTSLTNYTFDAGNTYYLSAPVNLYGSNVLEGGAVLKYNTNGSGATLNLYGSFACATVPYRPAVFTAKDDNAAGEAISDSTGAPTGYHGIYLFMGISQDWQLHDLRMFHAENALCVAFGAMVTNGLLQNVEFIDVNNVMDCDDAGTWKFQNILASGVGAGFLPGPNGTIKCEHLTLDKISMLRSASSIDLYITNSILCSITNMGGSYLSANNVTNSSSAGIFRTAGTAAYYLASNSPYRNVGITNIDSQFLSTLQTLTTYAPQDGSAPDVDIPDLGFHYSVNEDADFDNLPDSWEWQQFGNFNQTGSGDLDGDGFSNLQEYLNGSNPNDYYNGVLPTLAIVGGNNQSGMPNTTLPLPLTLGVTSSNGTPLVNAPVTFTVTQGGAQIAANTNDTFTTSLSLLTGTNGTVSVVVLLPGTLGTSISVQASASSDGQTNQVTFTGSTMQGLKLWLKADAGITNNSINRWMDQTTNHFDATQSTVASQPLWVSNVFNGRPTVHFDGSNDNFTLPNFLAGTTQAEVFVVLRAAVDVPSASHQLWVLGGVSSGGGAYPNTGGAIVEEFGSTSTHAVGNPVQPLDQFHIYNVAGRAGYWAAWINGVLQNVVNANTYGFWTSPRLGYGNNVYFAGDIAELLIFNRVLSQAERDAVNGYLNGRYALVTEPAAPTNLVASAISSTQAGLTWSFGLTNSSATIKIERKTGSGGAYVQIAAVQDATGFVDTNLTAGTQYYYRVKAANFAGESDYSNESGVMTPGSGADLPLGDLRLWLKADMGVVRQSTNNGVSSWFDQSGNFKDATQGTAANKPLWIDGALNGRPVVRFNGTNSYLNILHPLGGTTQAEVYVVLKAAADVPGGQRQLWRTGSSGSGSLAYPNVSGNIVEDFGSSTARDIGNPVQPLDQYHVYSVAGKSNQWTAWINGAVQSSSAANTYGTWGSSTWTLGYGNNTYFAGDIAELLIFNRVLSQVERDAVNDYLNGKYVLVSSAPASPVALNANAISATQINLMWSNVTSTAGVQIERKTDLNGTYALVATVGAAVANYSDAGLASGHVYYYRVRASNLGGLSSYSNEASALANVNPTVSLTSPTNNASFLRPANVTVTATAADVDGSVSKVEFFYDATNKIGESAVSPYSIIWTNAAAGTHSLIAKATDNIGGTAVSTVVTVGVSNNAPTVILTAPTNSLYQAPASFSVSAIASDIDGTVTNVSFFAGTNLIGRVVSVPYSLVWSNVAGGVYSITAVAYDNDGAQTVSVPTTVTVNAQPSVVMTSPVDGDIFQISGAPLAATVSDPDGSITRMDFFESGNFLGSATASPYTIPWPNVPASAYQFYAVAYDNNGGAATSSVVHVETVNGGYNNGAAEDSYVQGGNKASSNFGTADPLKVQTSSTAANNYDTYIKFFPLSYDNVRRVRFMFNARLSAAGTLGVTAYATTTNWSENSITWNNKPGYSNALATFAVTSTANTQFGVDVTSLVLSNSAAGIPIAFALHSPSNSSLTISVPSRDEASTNFMAIPYLEVLMTNSAPVAIVQSPADGAMITAGTNLAIQAYASSPNGQVTNVQFYVGNTLVGSRVSPPWTINWSNILTGPYALTVRVTDQLGKTSTSAVVTVTADLPPTISLTAPFNGSTYVAPTNIVLLANASDPDGSISQVEFFQGNTSLGICTGAPYGITWSNVSGGTYQITAKATDNLGMAVTSAPATIFVFSPPTITTQPLDQNSFLGGNVTFNVSAEGSGTLSYQWQLNGTNLPGQTSAFLTLTGLQSSQAGLYTVLVSNSYGSVVSQPAVLTLNVVAVWGNDSMGQLSCMPRLTNNIVSISGGYGHNLALRSDGTVVAWGDNSWGQTNVPSGLSNAVAVAAGERNSLVLKTDGTLLAWGDDSLFQNDVPAGLSNVTAIAAGRYCGVAIKSDSTVANWGLFDAGGGGYLVPQVPAGLTNVMAISACDHVLALKQNGTVVAWGNNESGRATVPSGLSNVTAVAAGGNFSLALKSDGTVVGWGGNNFGQLNIPSGLSTVVAIAAGAAHSLALKSDRTVVRWGGDAAQGADASVPAGLPSVLKIGAGRYHSIALLTNDANLWPRIWISSPAEAASFAAPTNITIAATASDWDGSVTQVLFYVDGQLIGTDSTSPFSLVWSNASYGFHVLTAKAIDNNGGIAISAPVSFNVSTSFSPVADAHVKESAATSNFGTAALLEDRSASGDHRLPYFRFDLSSIPVVTGAKLRFYAAMSGNATVGTTAYSISNTNWSETGITWNNRPALGTALGSVTVSGTSYAWYEIDVSSYVASEKAAGGSVISLALTNPATSTRYIQINSREAVANRPQLFVSNTNRSPSVAIQSPTNDVVFLSPANIPIAATASDTDGVVSKVEFFSGSTSLGTRTSAPYSLTWSNVSGGSYSLTAVATDNNGAATVSTPVVVNVNLAPTVSMTTPTNNAFYLEPATVTLNASASDGDGTVTNVEFYSGTTKLGQSLNSPYTATWTNVAAGTYAVTAVATDNLGTTNVSSATIVVYPMASRPVIPARLGYWRFETTNWLGEQGQTPKFYTNVQNITLTSSNHVLQVDSANAANLKYRDVDSNHAPNIDLQNGSIVFRFKPNWTSSSNGGNGPGTLGQLISVGQWTSDASYGCWNLSISADGNQLSLITQTNGVGVTNLVVPLNLTSNVWYQIGIAYTASNSAIYINAQQAGTNGAGITCHPDALVRAADGFSIGSNRSGTEQARGQFDDLETFNYVLSSAQLAERPDTDSDGLPDGWELLYGFTPYDSSGTNGPDGDSDGDGLTNIEEYLLGTNPTVPNLFGGGSGAILIHTPLE